MWQDTDWKICLPKEYHDDVSIKRIIFSLARAPNFSPKKHSFALIINKRELLTSRLMHLQECYISKVVNPIKNKSNYDP